MATPDDSVHDTTGGPIVLFDGVCNLCNAAVRFIVDRDPSGTVRVAALQSDAAGRLLAPFGQLPAAVESGAGDDSVRAGPGTFYLLDGGRLFERSTAALRVAGYLSWPWRLARFCLAVPAPLRDAVYDAVAKRRYRWFGRSDTCRVPTSEEAARFLG